MENNTGYIYTLIDPRTNLVRYVGQTINEPYKRLAQHNHSYKRKIGKIRHSDAWIKNLHKNNLRPIMEVIDECPIDELNNKEIEYIKLYKSVGAKLCNHSTGGESGRGCKMSEESIKKRLETCKTSELWKAKGAIHSEVMKQKHKEGFCNFGYMHLPKEKREEIGANHSIKMKEVHKNNPNILIALKESRNVKVCSVDDSDNVIKEFNSVTEAALFYKICLSNIVRVCKGKSKYGKTGGIKFKYIQNNSK